MRTIYSVSDDPLVCAVSLMGRTNSERHYKDHVFRPQVPAKRAASLKTFRDIRGSTRRRNSPAGAGPAMDLLRGVYTLSQASFNLLICDELKASLWVNQADAQG